MTSIRVHNVTIQAFMFLCSTATGSSIPKVAMDNVLTLAFLFSVVGLTIYVILIFNGLITLKNDTAKAWANIDVLLKQRHDELPNLVEACRGYINYERDTLEKVTQARSQYQQAISINQKAEADLRTTAALRSLFAVAENYPRLKANQNFIMLQKRITELENEIADRREYYNDAVNSLNTRIQSVPDTFVALLMNLKPQPMFRVENSDRAPAQAGVGA